MTNLRAAILLLAFFIVTLGSIVWQESALRLGLMRRKTFPQRYHSFIARLFGIRIRVLGTPIQNRAALMIANHTSWLDIVVFSAAARLAFIAKSEVRTWPFFATLARLQETVFVERAKRAQTGVARDAIRERLVAGDTLVLFAEGTSDDGNGVLPFKSALMGAVEANLADTADENICVPVQPVSVAYTGLHGMPMGRESRPLFAWYGDMELMPHLWEALKSGPIDVVIEFHPPTDVLAVGGRKALAAEAERFVRHGQINALTNFRGIAQPLQHDNIASALGGMAV